MANGEIFREIKSVLKDDPKSITPEAYNRLVLEGIVQLHERIDVMTEKVTNQANKITTAELQKIEKHEVTLYGDDEEKGGLVKDVKDIKVFMNLVSKILWFVLTPILLAIGTGIVYLVVIGAQLGK